MVQDKMSMVNIVKMMMMMIKARLKKKTVPN
jgi:hypothetical protein